MRRDIRWMAGWIVPILALGGCGGSAKSPAPASVVASPKLPMPSVVAAPKVPAAPKIRISPASAKLLPGDSGLQMVAESDGSHGGIRDLTGEVAWTVEPAGIVKIDPDGYVRPVGPGKAKVVATRKGERALVEVSVAGGASPRDFAADIVPILTRMGCSAGGCHGKADGQNGFHLSLFGYDPEADFASISRDSGGRRLLPFDPDESLFLRKATGRTPHVGGRKIAANSDEYRVLRDWIAAGAPERSGQGHGKVVKVAVESPDTRLDEPGPRHLRVLATFADGHTRDVTRLAIYKVNDDSAAEVSPDGKASLLRRAEADLVVRFQSIVMSTRLATIINPDLKFDFAALPRTNVVDRELFRRLESLKVPPSPRAGDAAFLRRVTLDLTGQQPDTSAVKEFLKDPDPNKRVRVVDDLLKSKEFALFWQIKLGDLLQISQARFGNGAGIYEFWLVDQIRKNTPWDKMVRELLTAQGDPTDRDTGGPVNYAVDGIDPKVAAEQTAQRFLGLRLRCAQCHDHPFDVWTQDDYFGLAAIFAKVSRGGPMAPGAMMARTRISIDPKGVVEHLRTKKSAEMRLPDRTPVKVEGKDDPRKALADWMLAPENPYFARSMANWTWAQFFGKGIAEPADDLSRANPPVHPELLDALAKHFVAAKFDLRDLIRTIATSEAYGMSSSTVPGNERDTRLFSHHLPRPLTAHQMADALAQVTDTKLRIGNRTDRRAIEIVDPGTPSTLLDTFGRCARANGCSPVATPALSLRQSLLLIGGDEVESRVWSLNGYLAALLRDQITPDELVPLLYYKTLCRPPSDEELSHWSAELKAATSYSEAAEDLFWALLNSREFAFNH